MQSKYLGNQLYNYMYIPSSSSSKSLSLKSSRTKVSNGSANQSSTSPKKSLKKIFIYLSTYLKCEKTSILLKISFSSVKIVYLHLLLT